MAGKLSNTDPTGHAWVCDGYGPFYSERVYTLYVANYNTPAQLIPIAYEYDNYTEYGTFYHMNWGWGGVSDGWFLANNLSNGLNYTVEMSQIANIRPKN